MDANARRLLSENLSRNSVDNFQILEACSSESLNALASLDNSFIFVISLLDLQKFPVLYSSSILLETHYYFISENCDLLIIKI